MNLRIGLFTSDFAKKGPFRGLKRQKQGKKLWGGVGEVTYKMALGLNQKGHKIDIFALSNNNNKTKYSNITLHEYSPTTLISGSPISIKYFYDHLDKSLDIVHAHRGRPSGAIAGYLHSRISETPFILTVHGDLHYQENSYLRNTLIKGFECTSPHLLNQADLITTVSGGFRINSTYLDGFRDETVVVPNGVEFPINKPDKSSARETLGLSDYNKVILYMGALEPRKNPEMLIKATQMIINQYPDVCVLIAGGGDRVTELSEKIEQLELDDNIRLLGFIPEDKKPIIFQAADIFCLPSSSESFGLTPFEAASYGLPVVLGDIYVFKELFGDSALYVDPNSRNDLGAKIVSLLNDDAKRKRLAKKAQNRASNYTWDNIIEKYTALYNSIIKETNKSHGITFDKL